MRKKQTYTEWKKAVFREMIRRGCCTTQKDAARIYRKSEHGPYATVPSPRELFDGGETPRAFVANDMFEGRY